MSSGQLRDIKKTPHAKKPLIEKSQQAAFSNNQTINTQINVGSLWFSLSEEVENSTERKDLGDRIDHQLSLAELQDDQVTGLDDDAFARVSQCVSQIDIDRLLLTATPLPAEPAPDPPAMAMASSTSIL